MTRTREAGILSGMDLTELSRRIENIVRIGTVHAVDLAAVRCRVKSGELITQWLPWHTPRAGTTRTWDPPTIGEQAIILSPSGEPAGGLVFYGFNSSSVPPPSHAESEHVTVYPDGARIAYDHARGELSVTRVAVVHIEASGEIRLQTPTLVLEGDLEVDGDVRASGSIVDAGGNTANHSH